MAFFVCLVSTVSTTNKHARNTLKDTTVPATRTGQDLCQVSDGSDPDGWETLRLVTGFETEEL